MKKYEYQIYYKQNGQCYPRVRWKILKLFYSKWYDIVSFSGTAVWLYPVDKTAKGYTYEEALQTIEDFKEVWVNRRIKD